MLRCTAFYSRSQVTVRGKPDLASILMSEFLYTEEKDITPSQLAFLRREKERIDEEERQAADRVRDWTETCAKRGSPGFVGRSGELFVDLEETRKWEKALEKREGNKLKREYESVVVKLWRRDGGRRGSVGGIFSAVPRTKKGGQGDKGSLEKTRIYPERDSGTYVGIGVMEDDKDSQGVRRVFGRLKKRFTV